jgi:predicted RNA-binding Zn-ribbon protein involved in translation (DUF1610 family)
VGLLDGHRGLVCGRHNSKSDMERKARRDGNETVVEMQCPKCGDSVWIIERSGR